MASLVRSRVKMSKRSWKLRRDCKKHFLTEQTKRMKKKNHLPNRAFRRQIRRRELSWKKAKRKVRLRDVTSIELFLLQHLYLDCSLFLSIFLTPSYKQKSSNSQGIKCGSALLFGKESDLRRGIHILTIFESGSAFSNMKAASPWVVIISDDLCLPTTFCKVQGCEINWCLCYYVFEEDHYPILEMGKWQRHQLQR